MRASRRLAIGVCAVAVLAAGCQRRPPEAANQRDLVRPAFGFALDVPDGWTWRNLAGDVVLEVLEQKAAAPATAGASPDGAPAAKRSHAVIHVVVIDREGVTPETWADEAVASSQELQSDLEVTGRKPTTLADGRQALEITLKNPRGLEPILQRMLVTVTDSRAYALMATVPESDLTKVEPAVQACFDSLIVW